MQNHESLVLSFLIYNMGTSTICRLAVRIKDTNILNTSVIHFYINLEFVFY